MSDGCSRGRSTVKLLANQAESPIMRWCAGKRVGEHRDEGFSLVEVLVAMAVAAVILTGLLGATIAAAQASLSARIDQQAGELLTKTIEDTRSLDYGAVAMATTDVAADPSVTAGKWTVPNGVGAETVVAATTGAITPHITQVTANTNQTSFEMRRYVTQVAGSTAKRVTVVVSWQVAGQSRERTASTIIVNTRRGLPLPRFDLSYPGGGTTTVNPGGQAQIPFKIKNLGARDSFQLKVMSDGVWRNLWDFYPDPTCAGGFDPTAMPSPLTKVSGVYVTGDLFPDSITCFVVTRTWDQAITYNITITGTSTKQPTASTAVSSTAPITVIWQSGAVSPPPTPASSTPAPGSTSATPTPSTTSRCVQASSTVTPPSGYTLHRFLLQNVPAGDTATVAVNPLQKDDCAVQYLDHKYSTNVDQEVGRAVATGGSTNTAGGADVAEWRWLAPVITSIQGAARVDLHYRCDSGSATLNVALGDWNQTSNNNQWTSRATATANVTCNGSWETVSVPLTVSTAFTLRSKTGANAVPTYLSLRVAASSGSGVRLNYDANSAPSALFVGTKP
ncbi:MAG: prepilin-type N-terminal cleavage/methylation domain-containing protein [Actinobacteria bacterium]|nr:MAG: prepilin-type N-terminal cleavage/methylation domain-containing protein [Actinomycetota bacterium]